MAIAAGTQLGAYQIVSALGAGGMGEVYRAHDPRLRRDVAIKILPNADPERRQRFEREAHAIAALNHPNIVTIYSVEEADGVPFLTMELVDGRPLSESVPAEGMPLDRLLAIVVPLANALSVAHEKGITHRDLKPANVMIGADGRVKILDFGLAKLQEVSATAAGATTLPTEPITGEGRVVGTVAYMSPEQAEGRTIDARSDLFSFGVMLYELATGRRPFRGDSSMSVIASILRDSPAPVTERRPHLPRELSRIVKRALAKDPEQRYQTAKDLRNDLKTLQDDLASGELSVAAPAASGSKRPRWILPASLAVLAAIAVAAAFVARPYFVRRAPAALDTMTITRLTATGKVSGGVISPDGKYVAHVVSDNGHSLWVRQVATSSNVQIVPPGPHKYLGVTFSPDGNYIYFTRLDEATQADLFRIPVLGGNIEPILHDVDSPVTFSPDGARFAFLRGAPSRGEMSLMLRGSASGDQPTVLTSRRLGEAFPFYSRLAWSRDGRTIAAAVGGDVLTGAAVAARLIGIDVATGHERPLSSRRWDTIGAVAWLSDDALLVSATDGGKPNFQLWRVWAPDGSAQRVTNDLNTYQDVSIAAATGSAATVIGDLSSTISIGAASDPAVQSPITSGAGRYDGQLGLAWTPDGHIVFSSASGGPIDLWIMDADGRNPRQLTSDAEVESAPVVSADGRSVVFIVTGATSDLWRLDLDDGRRTKLTSGANLSLPHCLPDGTVIFTRLEPAPTMYKVALGGGAVTRFSKPGEFGFSEAVSPDGTQMASVARRPGSTGFSVNLVDVRTGAVSRDFGIISIPIFEQWSARADELTFLESRHEMQEIWAQPVAGGAARKILDLRGERIFSFAWSRDGRLAVSHGPAPTDIVLLSGIQ